ncbi:hypothetical protein K6L44_16155 [Gluconacetobacter entanii]|uniref:hypothetical protein n=1 Tax=Gluconacetobacter entanii TaxID=108528 RepID=UPI001C9343E7|nr:hypothetical protein [Gluconacetobacter entanii]MBY4641485.1 hypothetical protein [Gluconacetobacter entanii]MCW4581990.1 hypothetical protein [Gluconacetobacter entanii]MCW4585268.1 hypothetical protein [Gluconacetobacter entanii]MCW4588845.1 hypothetical protein [Gluconacetobacter entanii]
MTHNFTPVSTNELAQRLPKAEQFAAVNLHAQFRTYFLTVKDYRVAGAHSTVRSHARQADARMRDLEDLIMGAFRAEGPEIEAQNWANRAATARNRT